MKKLIFSVTVGVLAFSSVGFSAQAHCNEACQDPEYDWVIKPEVLGDRLKIIANPAFTCAPRCGDKIVITGDPDKWRYTFEMKWTNQGYVAYIPLNKLPKGRKIRMNYAIRSYSNNTCWALYSEDNDDEWTGSGTHGGTIIDFMIQGRRVVPVD